MYKMVHKLVHFSQNLLLIKRKTYTYNILKLYFERYGDLCLITHRTPLISQSKCFVIDSFRLAGASRCRILCRDNHGVLLISVPNMNFHQNNLHPTFCFPSQFNFSINANLFCNSETTYLIMLSRTPLAAGDLSNIVKSA